MKLILLSGGSGKRLWPLSNDSRSKQFLKVLKNENDEMQSMVQRVWGQLTSLGIENDAVIATSKSQVDMINSQLGNDVPIIIEPERRDTFPAIALAASYLYSKEHVDLDEVVGVLPVDPYVENSFFERLLDLEKALNSSNADLGLMGVTPTYPSEKYGYIVPDIEESTQELIQVSHFKEKPAATEAEELLKQNALWNSGVFAFKLDKIISLLDQKGLPVQYDVLVQRYASLPKISFDYEVVEKTENIIALPYNGSWKDLGTWNTLTEEMGMNILGKGNMGIECEQNHIINELDIPVSVLGLSNIIVAASPDGILVSEKDASPRVKELVGDWDQRPMYEERRWGWYRVLDHTKYDDGNEVLTKRIGITASKNLSYQYHHNRSEVWTIVKGEGIFVLDNEIRVVRPGDVLEIQPRQRHAIKAVTDLEFIEVQSGSELVEEDIVRIYMQWKEIEEVCYLKG
ncbi:MULTISPECIES: sugar phosphate nucleotidyltransferase [Bacillus]|uniref:Cupin domain-containing protein n=3 Tax=Bacillus thuringiensis TaxID=1428 RepID=A0AAP4QBD0_BACTU|nr:MULTISPECIES: sugar phosphate nucleotidyltransferase [Bacillus]PPI92513.1 cupin domain-containing protein [Escherichia coli]AEA18957.1 Mannose-1-phosphate guanylyltransferase [Bacillus thuringiensis serovar chinensis CT-43]AFV21116.1 alginate biosynthesis protein AlgA [Bacillus thuringiensis Bt407]AGG04101.1 Mannose-1-phosphate guanylyltransferase (GDP) [Bacillus thuringiensis serovar thuringiensis str. IS5056]ARP60583.1 mannose-1-phosphate guanylyltransferase [Bacillus thuringiensis]